MSIRRLPRFLSALVLLPALPLAVGGWAVVTVREVPDHAVVGQPLVLDYAVRQHGVQLLPGLRGRVVARSGATEVAGVTTAARRDGHYSARLTLPRSGEWTITIHSGFNTSQTTLLPLRAVEPGGRSLPAVSEAERGRHVFVATGCAGCHTHTGSGVRGEPVGPDLTDRRFPAEYLARYLADPSIKPPAPGSSARMPALELTPRDVASLVAFLNADRRVSGR